jgi:hypothetical protein
VVQPKTSEGNQQYSAEEAENDSVNDPGYETKPETCKGHVCGQIAGLENGAAGRHFMGLRRDTRGRRSGVTRVAGRRSDNRRRGCGGSWKRLAAGIAEAEAVWDAGTAFGTKRHAVSD